MNDIIFPSIEDYLKGLIDFDIYATQLSSGKFLCKQRELQLPKLILGDRFVSTALQYHTILQQDCFYIVIPRQDVGMSVNGQKVQLNQQLTFRDCTKLTDQIFACDNRVRNYLYLRSL